MNAVRMALVLALVTGGCATALKAPLIEPPLIARGEAVIEPVIEGDLTPEEQTIAFLEDRIVVLETELFTCADNYDISRTIITDQDEHIQALRRSQKWRTIREWLRIGAGFGVGYVAGNN